MISKTSWLVAFLLLLPACSKSDLQYEISGVDGTFCVPNIGYVAEAVWLARERKARKSSGFSFGGCHRLKNPNDRAKCTLPNSFISANVDSLSETRNRIWSELKESANFSRIVEQSGSEISVDPESQFVVLENTKVSREWSIWQREVAKDASRGKRMVGSDRLVATCLSVDDFSESAGLGKPNEYGCYRYVRGQQFALTYRFISPQKIPTRQLLLDLDQALFGQVDEWRCKK